MASLLVDQPKMLPAGFGSKMLLAGFQKPTTDAEQRLYAARSYP